jgi:hypothetical protein
LALRLWSDKPGLDIGTTTSIVSAVLSGRAVDGSSS